MCTLQNAYYWIFFSKLCYKFLSMSKFWASDMPVYYYKIQFSSVSCSIMSNYCDTIDCSMPGFLVDHQHPELAQTHVHWVDEAIQSSHLLLSPYTPTFNLSQHQGLFQWVSSLHQVAKVLEFQLQNQSLQWICRTD